VILYKELSQNNKNHQDDTQERANAIIKAQHEGDIFVVME
jgi:hypothetical protein